MSAIESVLDDIRRALVRFLPGLTVLIVVMILLRGLSGSFEAIRLQIVTLASSFFGAGDGMVGVLVHTLPLAIAAAVASFAIASRMITFDSQLSLFSLAGIVLIGASLGGFLRRFVPDPTAQLQITQVVDRKPTNVTATSSVGDLNIGAKSLDKNLGSAQATNKTSVLAAAMPKPKTPLQRLIQIDWFAQPDLSKAPPREIPPLNLLPEAGGAPGTILKAIDQLLGYLVAYQPRLFLAAIVAGSWVGWSWHRRLQR